MVSCSFMRRTRPSLSFYWLNAEWCWIFSQGLEVSFSYEMLWCEHVKRPQRVVNICRISRQPEKTEPTLGGQTSRAVFLETSQTSGGGLQTLDHLPISRCQLWNFQDGLTGPSTLRSLNIIRKWLGILGAFWSLLEPWRMSACDYQVYIGTDQQVNRYINSSSLQRLIDNEEWVPFASFFVRWVQDGSLLLSSLRFQPPTSRWIDNRCMFISCLAEEEWIWQSELRQSELGPDLDYNGRSHRVLEEAIDLAVSRIL